MRRAYNEKGFIYLDDKTIIGVGLGFDFCAEHEWGIKGLQSSFGIDYNRGLGFEARRNTIIPKGLNYLKRREYSALIFRENLEFLTKEEHKKSIDYMLKDIKLFGSSELEAGWSENDFGVTVRKNHDKVLKSLYDAFQDKNGILMLMGSNNPFGGSGLLLADLRMIPKKIQEEFAANDKEHRDTQAMYRRLETESGIFDLLKKAEKEFYALSIKRLDENGNPKWWLNPMQQNLYEAGWFTTQDLMQWAEGKGPIIKAKCG